MITVKCPQNSYNSHNVIDIYCRLVFSGFNFCGHMAETSALFRFLRAFWKASY